MRKFALVLAAFMAVMAGEALGDSLRGKTHGTNVEWTTATGGDGFAKFNAKLMPAQNASGKEANGHTVVVKIGNTPSGLDVEYKGRVTCYRQIGNEAIFAGPRDDDSGLFFEIHVQDNEGTGAPDLIRVRDDEPAADCTEDPDPFRPVEDGDIKVHQH